MAVLLLAEVTNGELAMDATAKAVTAAKAIGDVTVLCAGASAAAAGDAAATIDGVSKVLVAEDASLGHRLAEPTAALIVSLAGDYEHIVAPATTDAKNVMPRVAALLDVMVSSDASGVVDGTTFERPVYAGNAVQTVKSSDAKKVITFRTSTFDAAATGGSASVETIGAAADPGLSEWVEDKVAASDRPELTSAGVVVSGGRGVGSEEDFQNHRKLGRQAGRGRGCVPRGGRLRLCPERLASGSDRQSRCTGSVCRGRYFGSDPAPGRYERRKIIVAINKDEEAPIFQVADFGLVADLFEAVPELTEKL